MTIREFIRQHRLTFLWQSADRNPHFTDDDWSRSASHYRCTIRQGRKRIGTYYSMGSAHSNPPTLEMVLDSLASDAASYLNSRSFEEWASDLGFDPDSRKAEKTYNAIAVQVGQLIRLLGDDGVKTLAFKVERL